MGHYASEMRDSTPFTSEQKFDFLNLGLKLLNKHKKKKGEKRKVTEIKLEWINPYNYDKRIWIDVSYTSNYLWGTKGKNNATWNCYATFDINETLELVTENEKKEILQFINDLENYRNK